MALPTEDEVRSRVEALIAEHWSPEVTVRAWWAALAAAGLTSPTLPVAAGGLGWPANLNAVVQNTLTRPCSTIDMVSRNVRGLGGRP